MLKNSEDRYGLIAVILHWGVALTVIGLFCLGLYMRGLDYYDDWYQFAPSVHEGVGIILFMALLFRVAFRFISPPPKPEPGKPWEHLAAELMHWMLNLLIFVICICGYLISTADNRSIDVFGWISIPSTITSIENQEDVAGEIHKVLAYGLIGFSILHALAALKHHFIDKDATLIKMLGRTRKTSTGN